MSNLGEATGIPSDGSSIHPPALDSLTNQVEETRIQLAALQRTCDRQEHATTTLMASQASILASLEALKAKDPPPPPAFQQTQPQAHFH